MTRIGCNETYIEKMAVLGVSRKVAVKRLMSKSVKNKTLYLLLFPLSFWYCKRYAVFLENVLKEENKEGIYYWVNFFYDELFNSKISQITGLRPSVKKILNYFKDIEDQISSTKK